MSTVGPLAFRIVALSTAVLLAYSTSAAGFNAALLGVGGEMRQLQTRYLAAPAPTFTDAPGRVYRGESPGRDPDRSAWWTPKLRRDLQDVRTEAAIEEAWASGGVLACVGAIGMAYALQVAPGGDGSGGGTPGEGGGPSGGSGGGATPGGGGSSGGGGANPVSGGPGLAGQTNTNTGNKLTTLPLVAWSSRGNSAVSLTLYHSSLGSFSGAFGEGWSHSYEETLAYTPGSSAIVREADGLTVPFTESGGAFSPPAGVYDALVHNADGTWTRTGRHGGRGSTTRPGG